MKMRSFSVLVPLLLAGCADDGNPTQPGLEAAVFSLLGGLEVGEALTLSGEQARTVYLPGGAAGEGGREYVYVPFFASEAGQALLDVEVAGANVEGGGAGLGASASAAPALELGGRTLRPPDWGFHERLRRRERVELGPRLAQLRADGGRPALAARAGAAAAVPAVGDLLSLNAGARCGSPDYRTARVEAVSARAIVVADTTNPRPGMTRADYAAVAREFDQRIHPVVTGRFDRETDIDENQRVIIFFTRAVNELTPPGAGWYVAGFFWAGDLFPRRYCEGSNEAEIFYQLVADPEGEAGLRFGVEDVLEGTPGTVGHEFQHLVNAGRRLWINNAESWEEVWLDEGMSHVAEELLFYDATGLGPGQNIGRDALVQSQAVLDALYRYQIQNLLRYAYYLQSPERESLLGVDAGLETRGAVWSYLRYLLDRDDPGFDAMLRSLVNARISGVANLARALERDPIDLMQDWTVSVYADDTVRGTEERFRQPSWNFRSIFEREFPLEVRSLRASATETLRLRGGGGAFVRVRVPADRQATLTTTSGGRVPPDRLRISVIRTR